MFFPEKIINIKSSDRVLEIGPGSSPYFRSDVLLEMDFENETDYEKQFGHSEKLVTDKKIVFYKGDVFPFADNEFDYVICSHVLEHVTDIPKFLSEVFRVAPRGYFEYPLITYDYLYNFDVHLNFLKFNGTKLVTMKKKSMPLNDFKPLHEFFLKTLQNGYGDFLTKIPHCFFEGFEWNKPFELSTSNNLNDFIDTTMTANAPDKVADLSIIASARMLLKAIKNRIKRN